MIMENFPIEVVIPIVVVFGYFGLYALWSYSLEDRNARRMERSAGWPQVQGVVKQASAGGMSVKVDYEYVAEGHVFSGQYSITFPEAMVIGRGWNNVARARALGDRVRKELADFPAGQTVILRYNPQDPSESVLLCRGELQREDSNEKTVEPPHFSVIS